MAAAKDVKLSFCPTNPEIEHLQAVYTAHYQVHGLNYEGTLLLGRLTGLRASAKVKAVADQKSGTGRSAPKFHIV